MTAAFNVATIAVLVAFLAAVASDHFVHGQNDVTRSNDTLCPDSSSNSTGSTCLILSVGDRRNVVVFDGLLDVDSLTDDRTAWKDPAEKLYFYLKLMHEIEQRESQGDNDTESKSWPLPTFPILQRKVANVRGRLLRYASEFEKISRDAGVLKTVGGSLGVVGGVLALVGLILAPFTAGGTLALTGVSIGVGTIGSSVLVSSAFVSIPGEVLETYWEQHYLHSSQTEAAEVLSQCDLLAGIVVECYDAVKHFEMFADRGDLNEAQVEALLWVKNLYVTARKSWSFVELPNKLAIIKDVIKSAKTVTGAFTNNLKEITLTLDSLESPLILPKDISKTAGLAAKAILRQVQGKVLDKTALLFSASGLKVPVGLDGSSVVWHTVVEAGSKAAVVLSGLGSVASIGAGIWSVMTGRASLKGSGILSDRIRKTVLDIETHTLGSVRLYEHLMLKNTGRDARQMDMIKVLTGLEVHTCSLFDAETDSPVLLEVRVGSSACFTRVLDTPAHNDLERNAWDVYDGHDQLGNCSGMAVTGRPEAVSLRFVNMGGGAHCADIVNLQVDYLDRAFITCQYTPGAWSQYGASSWFTCHRAPEISKIDIYTCMSDYAGTDSSVRLKMSNGKQTCFTDVLDNNGNDLARGYLNSYRQDVLGACRNLSLEGDLPLWVSFEHSGFDSLCVGNVLVHGSDGHFGRSRVFKCHVPMETHVEYDTSPSFECSAFEPDRSLALYAVRPHICDVVHAGSSTGFDYGVAFHICSTNGCCKTNYLDMLYYDELVRGSADLYSQPGALGGCYGFELDRRNVTYALINTNSNAVCLEGLELYSMQSQGTYPFVSCGLGANPDQIWAQSNTQGPFPCLGDDSVVSQLTTLVCASSGAGTDSALSFRVCREDDHRNCCDTGIIDTGADDDFEQGDFQTYGRIGNCSSYAISGDAVRVSVRNHGSDSVCLSHVSVRSSANAVLNCFLPQENDFWLANASLDLKCVRL